MTPIRRGMLAMLAAGSAFAEDNPCPAGSAPEFECDFEHGGDKCFANANTGQAAAPGNRWCTVPTPDNGCILEKNQYGGYKWSSSQGTDCCNCWVKKSVCPLGSTRAHRFLHPAITAVC